MAKQKFPEAEERIFNRVFICMKCGTKNRADPLKVRNKKVKCRRCKRKVLRKKHREQKS